MFNLLNDLNLTLQGRMTTVFKLADKVSAFKAKLQLWGQRVPKGTFDMFPTLSGHLGNKEPGPSLSQLICDHIALLSAEFERYFPMQVIQELIRNGSVTRLQTYPANHPYHCMKSISSLKSQMTAG